MTKKSISGKSWGALATGAVLVAGALFGTNILHEQAVRGSEQLTFANSYNLNHHHNACGTALVQQHLHEAPHIASIDLHDYLHRLASGLGQLRRAGRISVQVGGSGTGLVEPRTANALGMIVAEIVAECLDATAEHVACSIAIEIDSAAGHPLRVSIVSGVSEMAATGRSNVPNLGPRLSAAYAAQAEIQVTGDASTAAPLAATSAAKSWLSRWVPTMQTNSPPGQTLRES